MNTKVINELTAVKLLLNEALRALDGAGHTKSRGYL